MTGRAPYSGSLLIRSQTSKPLMSGSFTSSTIRSTSAPAGLVSASLPVSASTTVKPARDSQLTRRYRLVALSSTTRIVGRFMVAPPAG
jgi:hypothetical protein